MITAARNAELRANTAQDSRFAISSKHNVNDRKGRLVEVKEVTRYAKDEGEVKEIVDHLDWLNENRTAAGKYFDITVITL